MTRPDSTSRARRSSTACGSSPVLVSGRPRAKSERGGVASGPTWRSGNARSHLPAIARARSRRSSLVRLPAYPSPKPLSPGPAQSQCKGVAPVGPDLMLRFTSTRLGESPTRIDADVRVELSARWGHLLDVRERSIAAPAQQVSALCGALPLPGRGQEDGDRPRPRCLRSSSARTGVAPCAALVLHQAEQRAAADDGSGD